MITTTNLRISTADAAEKSPLLEQLAKKADVNRDGNVTSAEFTAFLSTLMKSLDTEHGSKDIPKIDERTRDAVADVLTIASRQAASPAAAIDALRRAISRAEGK